MAELSVRINRASKKAVFSGSGTFTAKDQIKKLGLARWNPSVKMWEVSSFSVTDEELKALFPSIEIENEDENSSENFSSDSSLTLSSESADTVVTQSGIPSSLSVSELASQVRSLIKTAFPGRIFVHGVLGSVKSAKEGRLYMELVEAQGAQERISCVIWRDAESVCKKLFAAGFKLEPDLQVMFEVEVELHRRQCSVSLTVVGVVAEYTIAKVAALREQTNERLKSEGIFAKNKKQVLSCLPRRLGILTSAGGTVINDFRASLDIAQFGFELFWVDSSVQGSDAKAELVQGLRMLERVAQLDAILIFRGGGSPADLAVFSEYEIAREVCLCTVPVISAIGHQEDQCSVQDVSYRALGVPKDIGRFFSDIVIERRRGCAEAVRIIVQAGAQRVVLTQQRVSDLSGSLYALMTHRLRSSFEALERFASSLPVQSLTSHTNVFQRLIALTSPIVALAVQARVQRVSRLQATSRQLLDGGRSLLSARLQQLFAVLRYIQGDARRCLEREVQHLTIFGEMYRVASRISEQEKYKLDALDTLIEHARPETQLARGFSLVKRLSDGKLVSSGSQVSKDDLVELQFHDSSHEAIITSRG